ncbi:MAG: hypothetical protein IJQ07_05755 [Clostridia bacterium]|nr:hypothetical protein [Clostridia bacterium]
MKNLPKIYLAIDNCFASKRWTEPEEWMNVIKSVGLTYVEASADTECDPLYLGEDYMLKWRDKVLNATQKTGVTVKNLYSGHGTYATLGLAHTDSGVRKRFLEKWLKPMCDTAASIGAGFGFYCHAFPDFVLQDPSIYNDFKKNLYNNLADLASYASEVGCKYIGCEQMYSPHQIPWTIKGVLEFLIETNRRKPMYITVDCGHQSGQRRFLRPSHEQLMQYLMEKKNGLRSNGLWLGSLSAYKIFEDAINGQDITSIENEMDKYPYLFAEYDDGDTYQWLEKFACFSPIIHLQQTDGLKSAHLPFTSEYNKIGIIKADKVLAAIKKSFLQPDNNDLPPKVNEIVLTLEMFTGTADINRDVLNRIEQSVKYWREFIPENGLLMTEYGE